MEVEFPKAFAHGYLEVYGVFVLQLLSIYLHSILTVFSENNAGGHYMTANPEGAPQTHTAVTTSRGNGA